MGQLAWGALDAATSAAATAAATTAAAASGIPSPAAAVTPSATATMVASTAVMTSTAVVGAGIAGRPDVGVTVARSGIVAGKRTAGPAGTACQSGHRRDDKYHQGDNDNKGNEYSHLSIIGG